jgi:hypothetical protein
MFCKNRGVELWLNAGQQDELLDLTLGSLDAVTIRRLS